MRLLLSNLTRGEWKELCREIEKYDSTMTLHRRVLRKEAAAARLQARMKRKDPLACAKLITMFLATMMLKAETEYLEKKFEIETHWSYGSQKDDDLMRFVESLLLEARQKMGLESEEKY